mgnify:FL=1
MNFEDSVLIRHSLGLHARPSIKFTSLAKKFFSDIRIKKGDQSHWVNAKSIIKVMGLKIPSGKELQIQADGIDADNAVKSLIDLVLNNFDEE